MFIVPTAAGNDVRADDWPQWRGPNRDDVCGPLRKSQDFPIFQKCLGDRHEKIYPGTALSLDAAPEENHSLPARNVNVDRKRGEGRNSSYKVL